MNAPADALQMLRDELIAIRSERQALAKRDAELTASEQRAAIAIEVVEAIASRAMSGAIAAVQLANATLTAEGKSQATEPRSLLVGMGGRPRVASLEDHIGDVAGDSGGLTSDEIVAGVQKITEAKAESVKSTLSRMVKKGLMRRDGRLYFKTAMAVGTAA